MSHNNEKILDKLKKLLSLSKSDNPHEAALALQRARKLMDTFGITADDIVLNDIGEEISDYWPTGTVKPPRYMLGLLTIIQDAFGVKSLILQGLNNRVSFYGLKERTALAAYTYNVLGRQLIRARRDYIGQQSKRIKTSTKSRRSDKFAEGWIIAVLGEIEKLAMTAHEEALCQRWLERKYTRCESISGRDAQNVRGADKALNQGYQEGRQVQLHQPVSGQEQLKTGGAS
jgi:hypothetical protein